MTKEEGFPGHGAAGVHVSHGHVHRLARIPFVAITRADRLDEAVRLMAETRHSALPVVDQGVPVGILTEREIVAACAQGCDPGLAVAQVMSDRVSALHAAADCRQALSLILRANARHLVLVGDDGQAMALLNERDLLAHAAQDFFAFAAHPAHLIDRLPGLLPASTPLRRVIAAMAEDDLGCVVIGSEGMAQGVITRRDVIELAARGPLAKDTPVGELMSPSPIVLPRTAPVAEIAQVMLDRGVRHVLLTRPDGSLDGVVTEHHLLNLLGVSSVETLLRETERVQAASDATRESLEARDAFYRALVDEAVVSIAAVSVPDGRFVEFNEAACRNLGYSREELAQLSVADIEAEQSPAEVRAAITAMRQRGGCSFSSRHRRKDGTLRDVEISTHLATMRGEPHLVSVWRDVTDVRKLEHSLRRAQEAARIGTWELDLESETLQCSDTTYGIFGLAPGAPLQLTDFFDAIHPQDRPQIAAAWQAAVAGAPYDVEHRILVGGRVRWVHETGLIERDGENRPVRGVGMVQDITERKDSQEQLEIGRRLIDAASDTIVVTNAERQIVTVNPAFTQLSGYTLAEVRGRNPRFLKSGRMPREFYTLMWEAIEGEGSWTGHFENRTKSGEIYEVENTITTIRNGGGEVLFYVGVGKDVSAVRRAEEQLRYVAGHDVRTGLINRAALLKRLTARLHDSGATPALICLDIDGFRLINDSMGYATGDRILTELARRLEGAAAGDAVVARTESDGFAVLLPQVDRDGAWAAAQDLLAAVAAGFDVDGRAIVLSITGGIALAPDDGAGADILLANAESAVAAAKRGAARVTFYDAAMNEDAREHLDILSALRGAAARRELRIFLQPLVGLADRRPVGAEALLRWQHPERGLLPPGRFLPLAEQSSLICDLTTWAFDEVCRLLADQRDRAMSLPVISVNLSAHDFDLPDLADRLAEIAGRHGVAPDSLKLEVTETATFSDLGRTMAQVAALVAAGFQLAIDDFGTGYSNIAQLGRLPADRLKIDRSLLVTAERTPTDRAVLEAVVNLGLNLGRTMVVEGIETEEQAALVTDLGCQVGQGYLFAKPMPADTFVAWWQTYRSTAVR